MTPGLKIGRTEDQRTCWDASEGAEGIIARLLSAIFERLWSLGKVSNDWKKANVTPEGQEIIQATAGWLA